MEPKNTAGTYYCTSFCNKAHRLSDGKPLEHECFVLPTAALFAEQQGSLAKAQELLSPDRWKKRTVHKGVRHKESRREET